MALQFKKASKSQARLRMALIGPAGSGKTFSSLSIAANLGERIAVIDTERGSASKYADQFSFDTLELESFEPETYVEAIHAAESAGYDVLIIDSLSHAWVGKGGALDQANEETKRSKSGNSYVAWRNVTPKHNALIDAIVSSKCHIISTMRSKTEYVQERDDRGRTTIRKVGMAPIQREGIDFEHDVVGDMTTENELVVTKSRCPKLTGKVITRPGKDVADVLKAWLSDGTPQPEARPTVIKTNGTTHTSLEGQLADSVNLFDEYTKELAKLDPESFDFESEYKALADKMRLLPEGPARKILGQEAAKKIAANKKFLKEHAEKILKEAVI